MSVLNCIFEFRQVLGKSIFAKPTGNAAIRWDGNLIEFTVVGVGTKYVKLDRGGFFDYYLPENGASRAVVKSGHAGNSGYIFFATKDDYDRFSEKEELASKISKKCRYFNFESLDYNDLKSIESILKPF